MADASEIKNWETLKAWLESRPEETRHRDAVILAHRAAMRVLPYYLCALNTDRARKVDSTALPILWVILTSGVASDYQSPKVRAAARSAARSAGHSDDDAVLSADAASAKSAAMSAAFSAGQSDAAAFLHGAHTAASLSVDAAAFSTARPTDAAFVSPARSATYSAFRQDARALAVGEAPSAALWPAPEEDDTKGNLNALRDHLATAWAEGRDWLATHTGHDFWIRWYEAALEGRPLTEDWDDHWKLLTEIALIPGSDWEQGAEHVAELIAEIEERFRLLEETRRLKETLAPIIAELAPSPIGHNNPPGGLDDVLPAQSVLIVWDVLNDTEKELEKPKPDKSALRRIAEVLLGASIEIAKYCGKLADKALQKAAEEVGSTTVKWAVSIGSGTFAAKMLGVDELIRNLAEALARYAGG